MKENSKPEPNTLPKPLGTYFYKMDGSDWKIVIHCKDEGWAIYINTPEDKQVRACQFYPTKTDAMEIVERELKSLGFKKKEIASLKNTESYYEYSTYPVIKIFSYGSRWKWRCGDNKRGIKKTKKLALEEACKHRKDT